MLICNFSLGPNDYSALAAGQHFLQQAGFHYSTHVRAYLILAEIHAARCYSQYDSVSLRKW